MRILYYFFFAIDFYVEIILDAFIFLQWKSKFASAGYLGK